MNKEKIKRTVVLIDDDGEVLERWESATAAAVATGVNRQTIVYSCKFKTKKNFRYDDNEDEFGRSLWCQYCKSYSPPADTRTVKNGWCLRNKRSTRYDNTCCYHHVDARFLEHE